MGFSPEERASCRLVGTPIGNLADMTPRAVQALREADVVFAEDTRTAKALLHHLELSKPLKSYHKDNEQAAAREMLAEIEAGKKTALISEAGMPGISDPGYLLVRMLLERGLPFEVVPGVSAAVHASVASGLCESGQYLFYGFLPHKGAKKALQNTVKSPVPVIFYESPHRVKETIKLLLAHFPAPVAVCRELTKLHEEIVHIYDEKDLERLTVKGEFCLVVSPNSQEQAAGVCTDYEHIARLLAGEKLPVKTIASILKGIGMRRNDAYALAQLIVNEDS